MKNEQDRREFASFKEAYAKSVASQSQEKKLTVGDLLKILAQLKKQGGITNKSEVWLSSDEEGNEYSPLMQFSDGSVNVGLEDDKSRLTLYPTSSHIE